MKISQIKKRLKELNAEGIKQEEIANILNNEGAPSPNGKGGWNQSMVSKYSIQWKLGRRAKKKRVTRKYKKRVTVDNKDAKAIDKLAMIDLFIQSNLSDSPTKKLNHIRNIIDL